MTKAIRIHAPGGPEVMRWEDVELPPPARGEARVRHEAVGLNFIDVYHRTGLYPLPLPFTPGSEGAGVVTAIGENVSEVKVGDRVAYATAPVGAYAEERNVPADRLVPLPAGVSSTIAAAITLKGLTAEYLVRRTHAVKPGETILVHAAAGGTGSLVCQWAKRLGARVIGVVGNAGKVDNAKANGCDDVIVRGGDLAKEVRALTGGEGVDVVYDSVGKATFHASLDSLRPRGLFVSFGNASGPVPAFEPALLAQKGSLFFTRPTLFTYCAKRDDLLAAAAELFARVGDGTLRVEAPRTFALRDAAEAHRQLESGTTVGSTVLVP